MLGNPYFYRSTIRNYVIAFGSMFNDVQIQRTNSSGAVVYTRDVPLAYGPTEKYLSRIIIKSKITPSEIFQKFKKF